MIQYQNMQILWLLSTIFAFLFRNNLELNVYINWLKPDF